MVLNGIYHKTPRSIYKEQKYQYDKGIGGEARTDVFIIGIVLIFYNLFEYSSL